STISLTRKIEANIGFSKFVILGNRMIFDESFSKTFHGGLKDLTKKPVPRGWGSRPSAVFTSSVFVIFIIHSYAQSVVVVAGGSGFW
ncbi:hypothetical protein QZH41_018236, partial [Actinostola sp. cb2023]